MVNRYNIGIIGYGRIGQVRAASLPACFTLVTIADSCASQRTLAEQHYPNVSVMSDWQQLDWTNLDAVIIATPHALLAPIALAVIAKDKHVLVEKPGAIDCTQLHDIDGMRQHHSTVVRVGFNHRFHTAIDKAKQMVDQGQLGDLYYVRGRYGHGGRIGYENEWRMDRQQSGGGQAIDQGVHLVDLAGWFLGQFCQVNGSCHRFFWQSNVEDNVFIQLVTAKKQVAWLHASLTEWKNLFSFEIVGEKGRLEIRGLGGSYGTETLIWHHLLPEMGPPQTTHWEYPMPTTAWQQELHAFAEDIRLSRIAQPGIKEAHDTLAIITALEHTYYDHC